MQSEAGLTRISSSTNNGVAECEFMRAVSISKVISNGINYDFDLSAQNYWILLADGSVVGGINLSCHLNHHSRIYLSSSY